MHICPLCNKRFRYYKLHIQKYHLDDDLTEDDFRILCYKNENVDVKQLCEDYKNLCSLPELKQKYEIDFKAILFILKYFDIHIRSISESYHKIVKNRNQATCIKKYGCSNPSLAIEVKTKKAKTFLEHYGVDNIWKTKEYALLTSDRWKSYTEEEKYRILTKNHKYIFNSGYGNISKLELRVLNILKTMDLQVIPLFKFSDYYHKYDFNILDTKILIEVYGDYWHANPIIYKSNQKIKYPNNTFKKADDIWQSDYNKNFIAESHGYKVLVLWENEIRKKQDTEVQKIITDKINSLKI